MRGTRQNNEFSVLNGMQFPCCQASMHSMARVLLLKTVRLRRLRRHKQKYYIGDKGTKTFSRTHGSADVYVYRSVDLWICKHVAYEFVLPSRWNLLLSDHLPLLDYLHRRAATTLQKSNTILWPASHQPCMDKERLEGELMCEASTESILLQHAEEFQLEREPVLTFTQLRLQSMAACVGEQPCSACRQDELQEQASQARAARSTRNGLI